MQPMPIMATGAGEDCFSVVFLIPNTYSIEYDFAILDQQSLSCYMHILT